VLCHLLPLYSYNKNSKPHGHLKKRFEAEFTSVLRPKTSFGGTETMDTKQDTTARLPQANPTMEQHTSGDHITAAPPPSYMEASTMGAVGPAPAKDMPASIINTEYGL